MLVSGKRGSRLGSIIWVVLLSEPGSCFYDLLTAMTVIYIVGGQVKMHITVAVRLAALYIHTYIRTYTHV